MPLHSVPFVLYCNLGLCPIDTDEAGGMMKIAMIGHKDFPSRSGGVEVVVLELATRLAARGEDVTVYNRGKQKGHNRYRALGVNVVRSFTFRKQSLNAMVYSFTATFHALFQSYDVIHYHAIGPSVPLLLAHLCGKKTVATIHGLNWKVDKWNSFASMYMKLGEKIAARYADEVVTLSEEMHRYFLDTYGRDTALVKNAVSPVPETGDALLRETFHLQKDGYLLYLGRISPEKGPQDLIAAFKQTNLPYRLVIAGEIPDNDFGHEVHALIGDDQRILPVGFVQGEMMNALYCNCRVYVLPSHTEGQALTLLEAMSCGANCLVSDIPENTTVLGSHGTAFAMGNVEDLARKLEEAVLRYPAAEEKEKQKQEILAEYGYNRVVDAHEAIYHRITAAKKTAAKA